MSAPHPDPAAAALLDRAALRDLLVRYACAVDRRDFDAVADCFAPDFSGVFGGAHRESRAALVDFIRGVSHFHTTLHWMGPSRIALDGDRARITSPALISHRLDRPDGSLFRFDNGEALYREAVERRADGWRIVARDAEPVEPLDGVRGLESRDPALAWLLDRAAVDDALARFALERDRAARADSATHLLGHAIARVAGSEARVAVRVLVLLRHGPLDPGPGARPWTPRWEREEASTAAWQLGLVRREPGVFEVAACDDKLAPAPEPEAPPRPDDPGVARLLARETVRELVARSAWQADLDDPRGAARLLGNQLLEDDGASVETGLYAIPPDGRWGDGALRWRDRLDWTDGRPALARREVLSCRSDGEART